MIIRAAVWLCCVFVVAWMSGRGVIADETAKLTEEERKAQKAEQDRPSTDASRADKEAKVKDVPDSGERVLGAAHQLHGNKTLTDAADLEKLAAGYEDAEDFRAAKQARANVLAIKMEHLGKGHWQVTDARQALDHVGTLEGLTAEQRKILREVNDLESELTRLNRQGRYAQAVQVAKRVLAIRTAILGGRHRDVVNATDWVAFEYMVGGEYANAATFYRQAMEIKKETLGASHPSYYQGLCHLARAHRFTGDVAKAEPLIREAIGANIKALGEARRNYSSEQDSLASLESALSEESKSEPLIRQLMEFRKQPQGELRPDYAHRLTSLGSILFSEQKYAQAEPLFRRATDIYKATLGEVDRSYATSLRNLAFVYVRKGEYAKSEEQFRQALGVKERIFGKAHPEYAQNLIELAFLHQLQREFGEAEPLCQEALAIIGRHWELASRTQSERQQLAMTANLRHFVEAYVALAIEANQFTAPAYEHWLAWKGVVANRQKTARAMTDDPATALKMAELQTAVRELSKHAFATPPDSDQAAWQRRAEELSNKVDRLQVELVSGSTASPLVMKQIKLGELQAALGDNVLVDYVEYPRPLLKTSVVEKRVAAFIVWGRGDIQLVDLGPFWTIFSLVNAWRDEDGGKQQQNLRKWVWEPVEKVLLEASRPPFRSPRNVLISPDGPLGRISFAALPGKSPGTYLLEEWPIAVIPAPAGLVQVSGPEGQRKLPAPKGNLLALGGVDYDANLAPVSPGPADANVPVFGRRQRAPRGDTALKFETLYGTRGELATIKDLYVKKWGQGGLTSLDGATATEDAFRKQAPQHIYLHIATHGFFAPDNVKSILARPVRELGPGDQRIASQQSLAGYHPNLLSGLALAGANQPSVEGDDGILTAAEVGALDLRGVELVVLSACETGLGERAGGEGLMGLQRAFQVAGAKTVIASLWKVDDVATRDLMERFYDNLWNRKQADGQAFGTLEALREAQLWMLKERGPRGLKEFAGDKSAGSGDPRTTKSGVSGRLPPYYWAAWVLSGDWR